MIAPGIYFELDESEYHAIEALSNSGIKQILCSPMNFWASTPWLNPEYEEEESKFMDMGKAYHTRIVEGKDVFYSRYAPALDPDDYPDALRTMEELRNALPEGVKRGGNKTELAAKVLEHFPDAEVWDLMVEKYQAKHEGKEFLSPKLIKKIEIAAAMIEKHPQLCKAFTGGYPEVSIVWNCRETGVPMKARIDYLKTQAIIELKTFGNPFNKPIDRAIFYAFASQRYQIQAAVYHEAVEEAKAMLSVGMVSGDCPAEWLHAFTACKQHEMLYIFQQTGIAPVARGWKFPRHLTFDIGKIAVAEAKRRFKESMEKFGKDPWVDETGIQEFDDLDFPPFISE